MLPLKAECLTDRGPRPLGEFAVTMKKMLLGSIFGLLAAVPVAGAAELNLYTTREPSLVQPLLEAFTASTGTKVNTIFLKDG
jgi:iron(III) transport system substrate-binding protein